MAFERHNNAPELNPDAIDLVVFDVDGVLINSYIYEAMQSEAALRTYTDFFQQFEQSMIPTDLGNVYLPSVGTLVAERVHSASSTSNGDPELHYKKLLQVDTLPPKFWDYHYKMAYYLRQAQLPLIEAMYFLEELGEAGKYTAAWTSRADNLMTPKLCPTFMLPEGEGPKRHGWFDKVMTADNVGVNEQGRPHLKPHEAGLVAIHQELGVPYERTLMVGDRPSDMIPAVKMGALACGILSQKAFMTDEQLINAGAHYIADSVQELREQFGFPEPSAEKVAQGRQLFRELWNAALQEDAASVEWLYEDL